MFGSFRFFAYLCTIKTKTGTIMKEETKNLIKQITSVNDKIDVIVNETKRVRMDVITAIRDFLKSVEGHSLQLDNLDVFYNITYDINENLYYSILKRVYYDEGSEGIFFELDDITLSVREILTDELFAIFGLLFETEREKKIAYINGKVAENKPYVIRLNKEFEITYAVEVNPELTKIVTKKIDHIAFTDNEEDGAKAFTDFTNGVNISSLSLLELTEIESEIAKGAYMVR